MKQGDRVKVVSDYYAYGNGWRFIGKTGIVTDIESPDHLWPNGTYLVRLDVDSKRFGDVATCWPFHPGELQIEPVDASP